MGVRSYLSMSRDWTIGVIGVAIVALALLAYALFGRPPYVFFSALRLAVAAATGLGAWALYSRSKRYLPVSACLLLIGGIHLFSRMRRSEWVTFNWCGVAGLIVLVVILTIDLLRSRSSVDS
jgi:hypothetical protein